jgi:ADP-heptose:LPS heptosyltransferase
MRTLVLNLTRFGDLLQTEPVLAGFKAAGDEVGIVCLENFAPATPLLGSADDVYPLPGSRILAATDRAWTDGAGAVGRFVAQTLADFGPDRVVNLTPSLSARLLGRLLGAGGMGLSLDEFGFSAPTGPWAAFLTTASSNRGCSPFNLVDIFRRVVGQSGSGVYRLARPQAEDTAWAEAELGGKGPFIGFQLGASEERRRWPVAHFARLGDILSGECGVRPVLLGSEGERRLAEKYAGLAKHDFHDLVGRTSIPRLAAAVAALDLLVTNDTGTMHLAAGLGVPCAAIFLATAQPWDTGPYLAGCLSLEPDVDCHPCGFGRACARGEECRTCIGPEAVGELAAARLTGGAWPTTRAQGVRAWESFVDEAGFMNLDSRSGHEERDRTAWIRLQRGLYRRFLDREEIVWEGGALPLSAEARERIGKTASECGAILQLLEQQTLLLARDPREPLKRKFSAMVGRLGTQLTESGDFTVLGRLWMHQALGESRDLGELMALLRVYRDLFAAVGQAVSVSAR